MYVLTRVRDSNLECFDKKNFSFAGSYNFSIHVNDFNNFLLIFHEENPLKANKNHNFEPALQYHKRNLFAALYNFYCQLMMCFRGSSKNYGRLVKFVIAINQVREKRSFIISEISLDEPTIKHSVCYLFLYFQSVNSVTHIFNS
jgi:hypothetical protein